MDQMIADGLSELEELRASRAIVYVTDDQATPPKSIEDEDVVPLYECLRSVGPTERLDVILHTSGGRVNVSRKISLLLRDFASQVTMLVPYKARSAGTLLCLGADHIVMGPLGELSPIDPQIVGSGETGPHAISSEDVRAYAEVATSWFGLESGDQRTHVFDALSARIFPATLGSLFRSDQQMRQVSDELLRHHRPDADAQMRQRIVNQLMYGYHAHDYSITRAEAADMGLRVNAPSDREDALLWRIWRACEHHLTTCMETATQPGLRERTDGLIVGTGFTATHVTQTMDYLPTPAGPSGGAGRTLQVALDARWRIS